MNTVVMIGRMAKDPELRFTASGKAVAAFSIAVNRPFSKTNEADFFNVVVWKKTAENCANYLAKGRLVGIEGRLQTRSYETQNGEKRYVTEIVANQIEFLEWGKKESQEDFNGKLSDSDIDLDDFQVIDDSDESVPF
ncbi:single-strand binding protein [Anaerovirgula multivorans]|uniref:Single-stranded DNA-binding protein n=1 Tax=Anaerovirgula multivorans TaxID=312168 RepID=A0A239AKF5_9FIRM|nr:single-stranded DNA-binding protein [Anaerovirgula multivorans]SNR95861.1 single-strand binding protein [Anaerovirgula multivorans]